MAAETLDVASMIASKFEPHRKNRFVLQIEGIDAYLVKAAAKPQYKTEEVVIPWINATRYLAGKTTFEPMSITIYDPIAPSGAQQVMEWIRLHYESISGRAGYADFYKRDIQLKVLDPVGTVVQLWDYRGCFLTDVNFGELMYEDGTPTEITLSIRFDNCCLQF